MKTKPNDAVKGYRTGKKAFSVWLDESAHWAFRKFLVDQKTTFQDWATERINRELEKAQ